MCRLWCDRGRELDGPGGGGVSETNYLFEAVKNLPPEAKVELFRYLGMSLVWDPHDLDCAAPHIRGIQCNCVPPASMWRHPKDVEVFLGETWEERLAKAEDRQEEWKRRGLV